MGLIRKSLMLSTAGIVSGSSKKQRVAKASLRELKRHTALLAQIADPEGYRRAQEIRQAKIERMRSAPPSKLGIGAMYVLFVVFAVIVVTALIMNYAS
jgi:hypothetical protein